MREVQDQVSYWRRCKGFSIDHRTDFLLDIDDGAEEEVGAKLDDANLIRNLWKAQVFFRSRMSSYCGFCSFS